VFNTVVQSGIKNIIAVANGVVNGNSGGSGPGNDQGHIVKQINFTEIFEDAQKENLYRGHHITFFEESTNCRLDLPGSAAKVYWLWQTGQCSPLYLHGKLTNLYYNLNDTKLSFGCTDKACKACKYKELHVVPNEGGTCHDSGYQSYRVGQPDTAWYGNDSTIDNIIVNVFFSSNDFCSFHPRYVEPQLLSSHTNLGQRKNHICYETASGDFINAEVKNDTVMEANWDCGENCFGCEFRLRKVNFSTCHKYQESIMLEFSTSIFKLSESDAVDKLYNDQPSLQDVAIYIAIGCAVALTLLVVGIVAVWSHKPKRKPSPARVLGHEKGRDSRNAPKKSKCSFFASNFGNRFATFKENKELSPGKRSKEIRDEAIQNTMMVANGILSIVFAVEWNSDNNPLLIIHNKFKNGLTVSIDVFDTDPVVVFADRLNFLTYMVNVGNAVVAFCIVVLWCITKTGEKATWMKVSGKRQRRSS
jgi:hypothetical protein